MDETSNNNLGGSLLDIFKTGIGAYERIQISEFENKARYDVLDGNVYQNGRGANNSLVGGGGGSLMPLLLIGGLVVVAVLLIK